MRQTNEPSAAGVVAAAVASLARRAGIDVEMPEPRLGQVCGGVQRDVRIPGTPLTARATVVASCAPPPETTS